VFGWLFDDQRDRFYTSAVRLLQTTPPAHGRQRFSDRCAGIQGTENTTNAQQVLGVSDNGFAQVEKIGYEVFRFPL
jgi:hypothetical protein